LTTFTEIGPNVAVEVISALVVSPEKFQLPANGLGVELPPGLLLFLQATEKRRQMAMAKKEARFNICKVFMADNEIMPDLVPPIRPPDNYFLY
jgi:hypothetical protein